MASTDVIDPAAAERIRRYGGTPLLGKILALFFKSTPARYQSIATGIQQADFDEVRITAHSLKSSAGNLGAVALQNVCQEIESAALIQDTPRLRQLFESLQTVFQPTMAALRELPEAPTET